MDNMEIVKEDDKDERPLDASEEFKLKRAKEARYCNEVGELLDRCLAIKKAIEVPEFQDAYVKTIRGNIDQIKIDLESVEKPRELAEMQGKLKAYRKMLRFPDTAVDALARKVKEIRDDIPLFVAEDPILKEASRVRFDEKQYLIITE